MIGQILTEDMRSQLKTGHARAVTEAAKQIAEADVLLLCTGAGFSADSGLAVYADVACVPAYAERQLEYHDLCQPRWLSDEPELFWGFWGQCFNDYRNTAPHEGYEIISGWADRFRHSAFADAVRARYKLKAGSRRRDREPPYDVTDEPGAFFAFTSNVDAHHFDWFAACEIRECHGNIELYQCFDARCTQRIWRAPTNFCFHVDKSSMHARDGLSAASGPSTSLCAVCEGSGLLLDEVCSLCDGAGTFGEEEEEEEDSLGISEVVPRIGRVRGGGRPMALRHMPGAAPDEVVAGFARNHPVCPTCKDPARPAILMFGDYSWQDVEEQDERWRAWSTAVEDEIKHRNGHVRAVILEFGAGCNVPTVRRTSERKLKTWIEAGAEANLVRVNPELPFGDYPPFRPGFKRSGAVISIQGTSLQTIQEINAAISGERRKDNVHDSEARSTEPEPASADLDDWGKIEAAFHIKAQGTLAVSLEEAYDIIVKDVEKSEYHENDFFYDVKCLKRVLEKDASVVGELSLQEIRQFLEMYSSMD